jgi:mycothiol synthase
MDVTLRALDTADIPAWAALLAAVELTDTTGEYLSEADLAEEMANPDIEVGKDIVGAYDGPELVGYFAVYPRGVCDGLANVHAEGSVRPDRRDRGVGTVLASAMMERCLAAVEERHPGLPAKVSVTGLASNIAQEDLLTRVGLVPERWNFMMRIDLHADLPDPAPPPAGYVIRPYEDSDAEAMLAAHNDAFGQDHPNFTPWTETMWKQWVTGSRSFRPALSRVVTTVDEPGRVVAYLQTNEFDAYFDATGRREAYVAKLGTLREHRSRGLAGTLLRHCLLAYRAAGYDEASLTVDSKNPTGALGIYERCGFAVESRWTSYTSVLPPR